MTNVRINKFLADSGICSRRKADEHILAGRVKINQTTASVGDSIDAENDKVFFDHNIVLLHHTYEYWAVYKPVGYVSTASDEKNRPKVTDLVKSKARLYPVGRLDVNSEGLMILTNDGELTNMITHASHKYIKMYQVTAYSKDTFDKKYVISKLTRGMKIDGKLMKVASVDKIVSIIGSNRLNITLSLSTGYNRQIRKMLAKLGLNILKLQRIQIGNLSLESLKLYHGDAKCISRDQIC